MKTLALFAVLLFVSGCASVEKLDDNIVMSETENAEYAGKSIDELLLFMDQLMTQARADELTTYAPRHYKLASDEAGNTTVIAKKAPGPETKNKVIIGIAKVRRYLEKSARIKATVLRELKDVYDEKAYMISHNISRDYASDYDDILDDIETIIKYYELGDEKAAIEARTRLLAVMKKLEGMAMVTRRLQEARNTLEKVDDEGLDDYAPKSYQLAKSALAHAKDVIMTDPRNTVAVDSVASEATIMSKHAYQVGTAVVSLQKINKDEMEIIILDEEDRLSRIAKALNAQDVRDLDLDHQAGALAAIAEELRAELEKASVQIGRAHV